MKTQSKTKAMAKAIPDNRQLQVSIVVENLKKQAAPNIKKVNTLEIKTNSDFELAGKLVKELKGYAKLALIEEEKFTVPLKKLLADSKSLFKPFRDSVDEIESDIKAKMLAYTSAQSKAKSKLEEKFASGEIKKVSTLVSKTSALDIVSNNSQVRKVWTAIEVDAKLTPREFLVPDLPAIKEALKAGGSVAGWKWEQVETIAI